MLTKSGAAGPEMDAGGSLRSRRSLCWIGFIGGLALGSCGDSPVSPVGSASALGRIVFVSSNAFTGSFEGVVAADQVCTTLAAGVGMSGVYRAWLSDDTGLSPGTTFSRGDAPFVMTSGVGVADHWTDLTDGNIRNPIVVDERGRQPDTVPVVWTGTAASGQALAGGASCGGWSDASTGITGQVGEFDEVGPAWSSSRKVDCDQLGRLYCFEQ